MPNWLWVVLAIVGVLVAGMVRERWRLRGMEALAKDRGLTLHSPFAADAHPQMAALAERLEGRRATRWGAGLTGMADGGEVVVAEHEVPARGSNASGSAKTVGVWYVAVAWPVRAAEASAEPDSAAPWPHGGQLARVGDWAAWRLRGNLTPANVELLLSHLPEARSRFERRPNERRA